MLTWKMKNVLIDKDEDKTCALIKETRNLSVEEMFDVLNISKLTVYDKKSREGDIPS